MKSQQRRVCDWLRSVGARAVRIEPARALGHPRLCFTFDGKDYERPISSSPSDPNVWRQTIRDLKRQLGVGRKYAAVAGAPAKRAGPALNTPFADFFS